MATKLYINSVGQYWFFGFTLAIFIFFILLPSLAKYTKISFYDKIFCPQD